ncbi:3-methyl-2-oxobutanoate hydroxymethyltransferase [Herbivorax sp. ANBcel31]|uniref:3-methyl-2-oxobutanoate hydroxymethyltransferase n=1 Tax=Herbivorax sp. ANBcel31 TaxID=3069754 RepID=UPI0027B7AA56|nr:3-methyl-2-oxobutanoate hydroxymethyltransferase [Herbivorax sp. ANBcel31]MDQ2087230.1 3-methyl-2-oxobutanoate hydroxymethyltransferase [Herbivorax sp. ANBcel31]
MNKKFTVSSFQEFKEKGKKISMLTAYDYPTAKILDDAGVHSILVGDSLGTVVLGYEDTIKVTIEDMIHHIKAVERATKRSFLIGDMPFLSYHTGINDSVKNAGRLVQEGGCKAIKLEGGEEFSENIEAIIKAGIPVIGHLGYTPQSINIFGGHKAQGKTLEVARKIYKDALALQRAGVFSIVLECVPYKVAGFIAKKLDIPVIGIGSGSHCDGQVLVTQDALGLDEDFNPKHAKKYSNIGSLYKEIVSKYIDEVDKAVFPSLENSFIVDDEVIEALEND